MSLALMLNRFEHPSSACLVVHDVSQMKIKNFHQIVSRLIYGRLTVVMCPCAQTYGRTSHTDSSSPSCAHFGYAAQGRSCARISSCSPKQDRHEHKLVRDRGFAYALCSCNGG